MSARIGPPAARSREALSLSAAAAAGRFRLQQCADCGGYAYPARDACPACWSADLQWRDAPDAGTLVSDTVQRHSFNEWFGARSPWRMGTVSLDAGPVALTHVHESLEIGQRVRVIARTDASGQGVLIALPETGDSTMTDDPNLSHLVCDPAGRSILVTDIGTVAGRAVAAALLEAGAARVHGGYSQAEAPEIDGVDAIPLDPADGQSVAELARRIGDSVDQVVFSGGGAWPGTALGEGDAVDAEDEMAINYFGLLNLARAFVPRLQARAADGGEAGHAWVNLLSVHALCGGTGFGTSAASQAAALSLSQSLRAELVGTGVRVVDVLTGPLEADGASAPPPRVRPAQLGAAVVAALQQGLERVPVGPAAEDLLNRYEENPWVLEREALLS
ncbi:SDR family NAD(P)-dependent oxidoreductase [Elongatibacter sediminis]|uniref:SDR family NAD(P)-dependent oxidoreductase n=1 Tax=Elongatibacter sediminis TaxID=3119006 RepID=A0AAW9RAN4_9GAMM